MIEVVADAGRSGPCPRPAPALPTAAVAGKARSRHETCICAPKARAALLTATAGLLAVALRAAGGDVLRIHDIQGMSHLSLLRDSRVANVPGVVTAVKRDGFFMEDPQPDDNPATSEGIFVFTRTAPGARVNDYLLVSGVVREFRPGDAAGDNLTITEITHPTLTPAGPAPALPPPAVIGGDRRPPTQVIEDDAAGDAETSGVFDPAADGLDFYETLEGMRVVIDNAVAVGPTYRSGEIPVIADNGAAAPRSARGGLLLTANDANPERLILNGALTSLPKVNVGARFDRIEGVLDYSFGNYKLLVTRPPPWSAASLEREQTALRGGGGAFTIACFNVENLAPGADAGKFRMLATQIVDSLQSPDLLALMEAQDNNGAVDDAVVDASLTLKKLIAAIQSAGGPGYEYRQIDPMANRDGGEPGGNIRTAFLFNPARLTFVDRPGGSATAAVAVTVGPKGPRLNVSPGRLDPANAAFVNSRKPLVGEFQFNGQPLFVIANHFNSKRGDSALFGRFQPPRRASATQRQQQATAVAKFVAELLARDANANIVALGDLNDFEFSPTIQLLKNAGLHALVETLPANERYTYVYQGNSQALDHILVSDRLRRAAAGYDIVHVNAEFHTAASDHDPVVARFAPP